MCHTIGGRNVANQLIGSLPHYFQGSINPRWLAGFLPSTVSPNLPIPSTGRRCDGRNSKRSAGCLVDWNNLLFKRAPRGARAKWLWWWTTGLTTFFYILQNWICNWYVIDTMHSQTFNLQQWSFSKTYYVLNSIAWPSCRETCKIEATNNQRSYTYMHLTHNKTCLSRIFSKDLFWPKHVYVCVLPTSLVASFRKNSESP